MTSTAAPKNGHFASGKFWFSRKGNLLTLGLTEGALEELGDVRQIDFPDSGDDFDTG